MMGIPHQRLKLYTKKTLNIERLFCFWGLVCKTAVTCVYYDREGKPQFVFPGLWEIARPEQCILAVLR